MGSNIGVQTIEWQPSTRSARAFVTRGALVDAVIDADRQIAEAHARRAELIDMARRWGAVPATGAPAVGWSREVVARRELATELSAALRIPERSAQNLVAESEALHHKLPATRDALADGRISYRHAQVMTEQAWSLPAEGVTAFEEAALPHAMKLTVSKFKNRARQLRERAHPDSIAVRRTACLADRSVEFDPACDGMAYLTAYLPAEQALAIYNRVTDIARSLQGRDEPRTLTQLRADAFADAVLDGGTGTAGGIRARVLVTVPALTLLGLSEEPASLEGYGPIDADTARRLAARAPSFSRLLTHPETGAVLSVGRDRYAVPEDLRLWLRIRDETCRFPGCNRAARQCDLDHTDDWRHGGHTSHDNLAHLCESHHNVKHHTRWKARQLGGGLIEWTSPAGKTYITEPTTPLRA